MADAPLQRIVSREPRPAGTLLVLGLLCLGAARPDGAALAADSAPNERSWKLFDETDQWLDLSEFLDTAYGFLPVASPITEPAVGYGAAAALVFVDRRPPTEGQSFARPNLAMLGGLATENGSRGLLAAHLVAWKGGPLRRLVLAAHLGNWKEGRLRTLVLAADAEIHLEFFGLGGDRPSDGQRVDYTIETRGGAAGGSFRFGERPIWAGLRYSNVRTRVDLSGEPRPDSPAPPEEDLNLDLAALTPTLTFDTRDNFFTPTRGWYLDLTVPLFREALGGDRDFERATLTGMHFRPFSDSLHFGVRATARASTDGTPFFLRPYVVLRGVEALRYQGEESAELEAEMRWQFHRRLSLVGFGGAGLARSDRAREPEESSVTTGGFGFRYLIARQHGLHMGLDLAFGPDDPILYVVFGSAWMRP